MSSVTTALIAFACMLGGALLGLRISSLLPQHHLSDDGRDIVKLGAGLIATLAALVLGLLVSSAKGSLDAMNAELKQEGAKVIMLDRVLASYGPETKASRELLRTNLATAINLIWPEDTTSQASLSSIEASKGPERLQESLIGLSPRSDSQRQLKSQAMSIAADVALSRWVLIEQTQQAIPTAFLVVLMFWLTMLFASFGLLSPGNATVVMVLFVCALSVSGAIFLIVDMDTPLSGMIKVSGAPLQKALANLGK